MTIFDEIQASIAGLAENAGASVVGALMAAAYGTRLPRFTTYVVAFLITGLPRFLLFAFDTPVWLVLAMCVVGGCASGFLNPVINAVEFERIPRPLVGRVTSLSNALCWSLMPLGGSSVQRGRVFRSALSSRRL